MARCNPVRMRFYNLKSVQRPNIASVALEVYQASFEALNSPNIVIVGF